MSDQRLEASYRDGSGWYPDARTVLDELLTKVLLNANDAKWDQDSSADNIAVEYVRWLESEINRLRELTAAQQAAIDKFQDWGYTIPDASPVEKG